jgi:hypothetical protein
MKTLVHCYFNHTGDQINEFNFSSLMLSVCLQSLQSSISCLRLLECKVVVKLWIILSLLGVEALVLVISSRYVIKSRNLAFGSNEGFKRSTVWHWYHTTK